jgi:hypothetical protein
MTLRNFALFALLLEPTCSGCSPATIVTKGESPPSVRVCYDPNDRASVTLPLTQALSPEAAAQYWLSLHIKLSNQGDPRLKSERASDQALIAALKAAANHLQDVSPATKARLDAAAMFVLKEARMEQAACAPVCEEILAFQRQLS